LSRAPKEANGIQLSRLKDELFQETLLKGRLLKELKETLLKKPLLKETQFSPSLMLLSAMLLVLRDRKVY